MEDEFITPEDVDYEFEEEEEGGNRRVIFIAAGVAVLLLFCCCLALAGWFLGDYVVEFLQGF